MKAVLCIDEAVGETRRCLLNEAGRAFRLDFERWSERGRAKLDDIWWGRAHARMAGRGWFVDLGLGADGVLETKAAITEGALVPVRIKSEAWADKGPVLSLADMKASVARPEKPGLHGAAEADPFLAGVEIGETVVGPEARRHVDFAVEEAGSARARVPGGGELLFDRTRALTTVDVDAAGRSEVARGRLDVELNLAAAEEMARQLSLRGIGGLLVADFVSMSAREDRVAVVERFRAALERYLGRASKVLEISALGLCEAAIARRVRPVADALAAVSPAELEGLQAIRLIGACIGAPRVEAKVSREAADWLARDPIGWRQAVERQLRARIEIIAQDRAPGVPIVNAGGPG